MHSRINHIATCLILGSSLFFPTLVAAGFSPVTHVSSDDPHPDPGADSSKWYRYHHLTPLDEYEASDPTYSLEDDTAWPSQQDEYSDTLMPVIW